MRSRFVLVVLLLMVVTAAWAQTQVVEDWSSQPVGNKGVPNGWKAQNWGSPKYDFTIVNDDGRKRQDRQPEWKTKLAPDHGTWARCVPACGRIKIWTTSRWRRSAAGSTCTWPLPNSVFWLAFETWPIGIACGNRESSGPDLNPAVTTCWPV